MYEAKIGYQRVLCKIYSSQTYKWGCQHVLVDIHKLWRFFLLIDLCTLNIHKKNRCKYQSYSKSSFILTEISTSNLRLSAAIVKLAWSSMIDNWAYFMTGTGTEVKPLNNRHQETRAKVCLTEVSIICNSVKEEVPCK